MGSRTYMESVTQLLNVYVEIRVARCTLRSSAGLPHKAM